MKTPELLQLISDLTRNASENNICVILGAGADIASGGILFSELKKKCLFEMGYTVYDNSRDIDIDMLFDNLFNNLHGQERSNILVKLMRETNIWSPSEGYQLLLLLAKEHIINSVITTNFDNLMERTEKQMGIRAFQVLDAKNILPQDYIIDTMTKTSLYIKIHGDIDQNSISHLTLQEINNKSYNPHFSGLVKKLLEVSKIIIIGYSGYDKKIADIFTESKNNIKKVYWCNPQPPSFNSPLAISLKGNYTYIKTNFDQLMQEISTHIFLDKKFLNSDSVFIWTLIKSKIEKLQNMFEPNREFIYSKMQTKDLIPRTRYEHILRKFILNDKKNLCILTGNSGVGKSTFIMQQFENSIFDEYNIIPVSITLKNHKNIMNYLADELGYITHDSNAFILQFVKWCNDTSNYIILIFDNFQVLDSKSDLERVFNNILDISYYARNYENVKFLISLRIETWNKLLPQIDKNILSKILYQTDNSLSQLNTVRIEEFSDKEMNSIFDKLEKKKIILDASYISGNVKELIKIPFFYGILIKEPAKKGTIISSKELYENLNSYSINHSPKNMSPQRIQFFLEMIGGQMFLNNSTTCELDAIDISENTINMFVENGLLVRDKEVISFRYNVQTEYYISQYICSELLRNENIQNSIVDLYHNYLHQIQNYNGFIMAFSIFEKNIVETLDIIVYWIRYYKNDFIIQLAHDIVSGIALNREKELLSKLYLSNNRYQVLFPCFLRASSFMSDISAYKLFEFIYQNSETDTELMQEIKTLLVDRFSMELKCAESAGVYIEKYKRYLLSNQPSEYMILLLRIISNIGLENTSIDKYEVIVKYIHKEILQIDHSLFDDEIITILTNSLVNSAYYTLFNAGEDLVEKFYSSENFIFNELLEKICNGNDLNLDNIKTIHKYVSDVNNSVAFIKGNLLMVYNSLADYEKSLKLMYDVLDRIDETIPVEIIDYYLSCVFMITYLNQPLERETLVSIMNRIASKSKKIYFRKPDRISTKVKFSNEFSREFEDGFNPLAYYAYTAPIQNKNSIFLTDSDQNLYGKLKRKLEDDGDFVSTSRILHALGQMISIWPKEGLNSLEAFCDYQYPIVRNMLVRILKESYLRYPVETLKFLEHTGSSFQEEEIKEIKSVSSLAYTKRMMEQIHWSRILYFIQKAYGKRVLKNILSDAIREKVLSNLIKKIIFALLPVNIDETSDQKELFHTQT